MVVAVAKKFPGRPVKVIWSREETTRQGRFRYLQAAKMRTALDATGMPVAFHGRVSGGPGMSVRYFTDGPHASGLIDNVQVESNVIPLHILTGPYRGPGYNSNAFFMETFFDECAHAAGMDPMEYRLKMFAKWPDKGWTMCLKEVAVKSGWGKKLPKGWGQGVAIANWGMGGKAEAGTTVAAVATVEVTKNGVLRVDSIDIAFDTGRILNRDAVAAQLEGGVIYGLNMALNEQLTIQNGRIVEGNYHEYPMLRIGDMPRKINVHFGGLSGHSRIFEIGEPPVGVVGPAVGNAIFKATGKRVRTQPFRLQDLSWT
jgi:isoquinoline 1-oxidoreductase beta subunit